MNIVYCFIGKLPNYTIETVHQLRLFYDGPVYFIVSDNESDIAKALEHEYKVTIIKYESVKSIEFTKTVEECYKRFIICHDLKGREHLFICAFERFFLLYNLMNSKKLTDVFFVELDNLVYEDPRKWTRAFQSKPAAWMFDNVGRCSSGVCYFKQSDILDKLNNHFLAFIRTSPKLLSEMSALWEFWEAHKDSVQILPTHWTSTSVSEIAYSEYDKYESSIFDAAALGIFIGGIDPIRTKGVLKKGIISTESAINYGIYEYEWRLDDKKRNIPYVLKKDTNQWLRINNLHIHSKHLIDCLSKPCLSLVCGEFNPKPCCKNGMCMC